MRAPTISRVPYDAPGRSRRALLGALAAAAASWALRPPAAAPRLRVGVVGGGIVGASIALHLARSGAAVWLFEKAAPAQGATRNSFAWVNAFVDDPHYRTLRLESIAAYHALDRALSLGIVWGGYLDWASDAAEAANVRAAALQLEGSRYPVQAVVAQQIAQLDPHLVTGPLSTAIYSPIDAHLDPVEVTRRFLAAATAAGANVLYPCELTALDLERGRLRAVRTTQGTFSLDRLVVAAGVDTPRLLAMAGFGLALRHAPGILAHSTSVAPLTRLVHDVPGGLEFKQMANGSVVGTDAPSPPDIPAHQEIRTHAVEFPTEELRRWHGERIIGKIAKFLPGMRGVPLGRLTLGFRPMPSDELPVMGSLPTCSTIHVAVTHSGVTLAPIVGRLTAEEVLSGSRAELFTPYRPERFGGRSPVTSSGEVAPGSTSELVS
jgi:glycine/D-amino acid oxidase-like deaminating enzyme